MREFKEGDYRRYKVWKVQVKLSHDGGMIWREKRSFIEYSTKRRFMETH